MHRFTAVLPKARRARAYYTRRTRFQSPHQNHAQDARGAHRDASRDQSSIPVKLSSERAELLDFSVSVVNDCCALGSCEIADENIEEFGVEKKNEEVCKYVQ